ncbi:MAG: hypothetical protein V4850_26375 [Myxococcota bacterium]
MLLPLLLSLACAPKITGITTLYGDASDGHYLVVSDEGEVFDCLSRPDGTRWDPECILVEFHNSYKPPAAATDDAKKDD